MVALEAGAVGAIVQPYRIIPFTLRFSRFIKPSPVAGPDFACRGSAALDLNAARRRRIATAMAKMPTANSIANCLMNWMRSIIRIYHFVGAVVGLVVASAILSRFIASFAEWIRFVSAAMEILSPFHRRLSFARSASKGA